MSLTSKTRASFSRRITPLCALAACLSASLLTGCGMGMHDGTANDVALKLAGSVHGGQQPVSGAAIQLYAVGTAGLGSASTALIGSSVTTNSTGGFSITGTYSCSGATQVYLVATGGNPGAGANPAIALAAALGNCSDLNAGTFIQMNELTTVAAAYALAPFEGATYTSIGAPATTNGQGIHSTYTAGLSNSFGTANALVNFSTGAAVTNPAAGLTVPVAELNTLADILASCVNSTGSGSSGCTQLFSATGATNTLDAAFAIAKNPGTAANVGLYTLVSATAPFQPTLTTAPTDFTVAVKYTGTAAGPLSGPAGIAIESTGTAFVTNQGGNSVTAVSPLALTYLTGNNTAANAGGLLSPIGIAFDTTDYVWIASPGAHKVVELAQPQLSTTDQFLNVNSRAVGGFGSAANPISVATDQNGGVYTVSPAENTLYSINSNAAIQSALVNSAFVSGSYVALSRAGTLNLGTGTGQICTVPTSFTSGTTPTCAAAGSASSITGLSFNYTGDVGYSSQSPFIFGNTGSYGNTRAASSTFLSPFGRNTTGLAFDASGKAYILDGSSVAVYTGQTANSPNTGYGTLNNPAGIAVDTSGNVWVTNSGDNTLSVFVGLATPTITPIASNLQ